MFTTAFAPAVALMSRLRYAQKLALIGLVLLVPLAFVTRAYLGQQNDKIAFSAKERLGVTYITPVNDLLVKLVQARAAAVRAAGNGGGPAEELSADTQAVDAAA